MLLLNCVVIVIGAYCVLESLSAAADMHGGDRLCRFFKFLFAAISGAICVYKGFHLEASIGLLVMITSIALGVWPRMVYRIFGGQRNTDIWKGRYR